MEKVEAATRLALEMQAATNRHDLAAMLRLLSEECILESALPAPDGTRYAGKAAVAAYWQAFFDAAPHAARAVEDVFGQGWHCVLYWHGDVLTASGEVVQRRGVDVFEVRDGLIRVIKSYVKG
ncbi:MAG: nuclear transport factor 2 family protein [Anaerolineae bacterium]